MPPKPPAPLLAPPEQSDGLGRRTVYLAEVLAHVQAVDLLPLGPALLRMRDRLATVEGLTLYVRGDLNGWACAVRVPTPFFDRLTSEAARKDGLSDDIAKALRVVAMLASDAAALFGYGADTSASPAPVAPLHLVEQPASSAAISRIAPAIEAIGGDGELSADDDLPAKRRRAVAKLRELEAKQIMGARQKVADAFRISLRTVGKWLEAVEKEEEADRKSGALSAGIRHLSAS